MVRTIRTSRAGPGGGSDTGATIQERRSKLLVKTPTFHEMGISSFSTEEFIFQAFPDCVKRWVV